MPVRRPFAALCRLTYHDEESQAIGLCDEKFDDPDQFEEHMARTHRRKKPKEPKTPRPWCPVRRRHPYEPGEHGVGAWITFAERRDGQIVLRRGQVWSLGPLGEGNSRWVIPEDEGDPVVVRINQRPALTAETLLDVIPGYEMQRMNVRRAENLRRFGRLYPVVVDRRRVHRWTGGQEITETWSWHVDPSCPDAAGKPAPDEHHRPRISEVVSELLTGAINASTSRYCRRCFWLDSSPAEGSSQPFRTSSNLGEER